MTMRCSSPRTALVRRMELCSTVPSISRIAHHSRWNDAHPPRWGGWGVGSREDIEFL